MILVEKVDFAIDEPIDGTQFSLEREKKHVIHPRQCYVDQETKNLTCYHIPL